MAIWRRLKQYKDAHPEAEEDEKPADLEKNDFAAMLLAAFLTLVLPCLLILTVLALIVMARFGVL